MKTRVALYIRVSTEEQAKEGFSLEAQEATLSQYCSNLGYTIAGTYIDDGKSGKNMNRPALQKLIEDCSQKKFDIVLVWKLSRLSRKLKDTLHLIDYFEKFGIGFLSFSEPLLDLNNNPAGKLMLSVVGSFAEFERNTIVENVKLGMNQRAKLGKWNGGRILGYDIINKELIVNPDEANIIRMIFNLYVNGTGCISIRDKLNELNFKTKNGKPLTHIAILTILENPTYKGFIRHGRTTGDNKKRRPQNDVILVKGIHEAIVDEETFNKAQSILKNNKRTSPRMPSNPHLLSGLLKCPECGGRMNYQPAGQRKHNFKHGGYYTCSTYKNTRGCTPNVVKAKALEGDVLSRIKSIIINRQVIEAIVNELNADCNVDTELIEKQILQSRKQINKLKERLNSVEDDYIAEKISIDEYRKFNSKIELSLNESKSLLEQMEHEFAKALNTTYDANEVLLVLENFDTLMENADVQLKKHLLESLIERINLNPDKTLKNIEFKFEVPNQHATENNDKNVILTCGTVLRD